MSEVNENQVVVQASSRYPPGLFGNTPLGYVKDGKWHVTVPSNFPEGGFKNWSRCAFFTVTPDRRYVPAVCKDPNVGPGDTFVIDYPKVPKEGTVKVVRVVMPVLPDWQTIDLYNMSTAEAAKRHGADCFGRGGKRKGWFLPIDNKGKEMRLFPPVGVKPGEEFFVEVPLPTVCGMHEAQVPCVIFCFWWIAKFAIEVAAG